MPDEDTIIEIPAADEIALGHDPDGLPKTVPGKAAAAPVVEREDAGDDGAAAKAEADRIAQLERAAEDAKREADAHKARAEAAENAAREAMAGRSKAEETASLRTEQTIRAHMAKVVADHDQIQGAITATQTQLAAARQQYLAAREAGDATKEIEAAEQLAEAKAALQQLEAGKIAAREEVQKAKSIYDNYQAEVAARPASKQVEEPKRPPTADEWIDSTRAQIGDRGADWLKTRKEFVTDPKLNKKFIRFADEYADDFGQSALRSADFIKALNERFFPDEAETSSRQDGGRVVESDPEPAPKPKARVQSAAPVSRGNQFFSSRNLDARQVKLPPRLAAKIKEMGLDATKYALETVELIKKGDLPKNYLDPEYPH